MARTCYNYPPEIINRLQGVELQMLKDFDKVCNKYGLTYFALFGTAIGAIRHKGFIPWDDDIDIGLMKEDYEKLRDIPKEEWGSNFIVFPEDDVAYHMLPITRLYRKGTAFVRENALKYDKPKKKSSIMRPIFFDIFEFSHVPSVEAANEVAQKMVNLQRFYWYSKTGMRINKNDSWRFKIRCVRNDLIHKFLNLKIKPELYFSNKFKQIINKMDARGGSLVTTLESAVPSEIVDSCFDEKDMFPVVRVPFEDTTIPIQKNYHEMLTSIYGDYMQLPPEEKRVNHTPAILDFGDGKGNVIK